MAVCEVTKTTWTNSFAACNLDLCRRVDFQTWWKKIQQYLLAGNSFKAGILINKYLLLPSWWQELPSQEKKEIVRIVDKHSVWMVDCLYELKKHHNILLKDMQNVQICVESSKENPNYLEQTGKVNKTSEKAEDIDLVIFNNVKEKPSSVNKRLMSFQLKPKGHKN